jgi:hypothetical protein
MIEFPIEALVDEYLEARNQRLTLARAVDNLEKQEAALKKLIEKELQGIGGDYKGDRFRVTVTEEIKPTAEDWGLVHHYIIANNAFDLLQKRLTESAVKARWEDGIAIPGIAKFPVTKLSITKA